MGRKCLLAAGVFSLVVLSCEPNGDGGPSIAAPSGLVVISYDATSVQMVWEDNSGNEEGFRIYRSVGGGPFEEVGTRIITGYYDGDVAEGTAYRYYVTAYAGADESYPSNTVRVVPSATYVHLLQPNGGETLTIGDMYDITWDTNMSGFDARIYLSVDAGVNWTEIQFAWAPNSSPYPWKVGYKDTSYDLQTPPEWEQVVSSTQTQCRIRIEHYEDSDVYDISDTTFTIQP